VNFSFPFAIIFFSWEVGLKRSQLNASKAANGSSNASSEANPRKSQGMTRVGTNPGLEMLGKWKYREGEGKWVIIGSQAVQRLLVISQIHWNSWNRG
jgi:hypothetical protein